MGLFALFPTLAHAHGTGAWRGWHDGFTHPLFGWDHLLAMLAVGVWAAQQRGRAFWMLPLTFVSVMSLGAAVGVAGAHLPGVELVILASVFVFGVLVLRRVQVRVSVSVGLVGFFAFFHGFAHGAEIPASASVVTFGLGFVFATLLLHGMGLVTIRGATLALACLVGSSAMAQSPERAPDPQPAPEPPEEEPIRLRDVLVIGREDSLIGIADSASEGTVGAGQLMYRPMTRAGEILETVPGVIVTQHAGGGKANQYFLRGFNLDHGTDFLTTLDGMPLNLPSHGHGQGYTDMNIVIPELIQRVNYQKGVYYAENGDFSSAGAAHLESFQVLPHSLAIVEGGMYGYARGVFASSPRVGRGDLLYGLELYHHDGPWRNPDDYQRINGVLTYSEGDASNGFSVTARAYAGRWDSSDQVARSAVREGVVDFFDSLDDTTGGDSQRYSLQVDWHRQDAESATRVRAYGFFYDLDLFSNFTYFLVDTNRGDQFQQQDRRFTSGLQAAHTLFGEWRERSMENTIGLQVRNDVIENGLFQTEARRRMDKISAEDGSVIPATTRKDDILQTSVGMYLENRMQWAEKFRTVAGVRGDLYHYDVDSTRTENSDSRVAAIGSPKLTLVFGPWAQTEVYAQGGLGFHSNDGRGVMTRVDPVTGEREDAEGNPIRRADPLVRTYGAETGVRTTIVPGLHSTLSMWWLDIDSELIFVGDAGGTEASRPSRRVGVEWANFYNITRRLTLDADYSFAHARFRDSDPAGRHIPGAIENVIAAGLTYTADCGFFGGVRLRYFGSRPLTEDNSFRSGETILLSAKLGYRFNKTWTLSAEILNLLDRRDHDITYAYESRVRPGDPVVEQVHFHPVEPIQARFALTARF